MPLNHFIFNGVRELKTAASLFRIVSVVQQETKGLSMKQVFIGGCREIIPPRDHVSKGLQHTAHVHTHLSRW